MNQNRSWPLCAATSAAAALYEQGVVDVVDLDLDVVLLAPLLDVRVVEPLVVGGHEVRPLS